MKENRLDNEKLLKIIINNYKKIFNTFFKYSIFIIIFLISIFSVSKNLNTKVSLDINDDFIVEKIKLIGEFNKKLNQSINDENIINYVTNGVLETNDELLLSVDNLLLYKDLVMPKNVFLYNISPINGKSYFSQTGYDIKELETFARNTIFSNSDKIEKSFKNIISLPINESLENTFYTNCIHQFRIFNRTCDYYIKNFLNNFYIYNVPNDYKGLQNIFNDLNKSKYKKDICESMKKYILYSNDTNQELENIFLSCGDEYYKTFETLKIFLEIQDQLNKGYINSLTYDNSILNNYKLISYQQLIYNNLQENIINNISFDSYTNYIKSILKDPEQVDSFYLDLTYRFNNNYIISLLNKLKYKVTEIKKTEIENIIKNLNVINNGDNLEGYIGLKDKLVNKNLEKTNIKDTNIIVEIESEIYKILNNLKSLSFLKIINEKVSENKIKISGYFSIKLDDSSMPLYLGFLVNNIDNKPIIESININEYEDLNNTVSNIIKQKNYTITEIYQYIQDNINIFLSKDKLSTCDLITDKIEKVQNNNKEINKIDIIECNGDKISLLKEEEINKEKIKIYYKIIMENFNISEILISDKDIENEIRKYLNNINTNHITIPNIIGEIVSHHKKEISIIKEGSNNIIMTIEDLERYLGAIPKDIAEVNNTILAEFSIKNTTFIGNYDIKSKKLGPLYFKYDTQNNEDPENKLRKEDLFIQNFQIYLKDDNQNQINEFLIDPVNYIKNINPTVVQNYNKLKYK